ncbi:MAG: TrkH family potassium uptake protein [Candidatus Nanopelagicales bacterium]
MAKAQRRRPVRAVLTAYAMAIGIGTLLLSLPVANRLGIQTPLVDALFTSTSAVTVTGHTVLDTGTHWSPFGLAAIAFLIQLGGLGIVSLTTFMSFVLAGKINLSARISTMAEIKIISTLSMQKVFYLVIALYLITELVVAFFLTGWFYTQTGESLLVSFGNGVFHSISAFNNAGFSTFPNGFIEHSHDFFLLLPIFIAVVIGGLGIPVLLDIRQYIITKASDVKRRFVMSLHTRITLITTVLLGVFGAIFIGSVEWSNPGTLGGLTWWEKIFNSVFLSASSRTAGFNTIDINAMDPASWYGMDILMFIGGGSASTAGGIKVTTFAILMLIVYTEIRGEAAVNAGNRRLPRSIQRQALTIVTLSAFVIFAATWLLLLTTDYSLDVVLFEVISAAATTGLSTGMPAELHEAGKILLSALMFAGRLGTVAIAGALALRATRRRYELPKERPLIG